MKANGDLVEVWRDCPNKEVAVIIHLEGSADQHVSAVEARGMSVVRTFRLTNTMAAKGAAGRVLDLLDEPWVRRIELDREVRAFR